MTRIGVAGAVGLAAALLAGCASETPAPPAPAPPPIVPAPAPPAPVAEPSIPSTIPTDTCGANTLAGVIGQSRTSIPIPVDLSRRRVVCTTCPRTQEFRPDRQTILYDAQTGRVTAVTCG